MAQKVITVNINVYEQTVSNRHSAYEVSYVNRYLDAGWEIKDIIHSSTAAANWTNLTFILEKKDEEQPGSQGLSSEADRQRMV